jgi:hypothetical protein
MDVTEIRGWLLCQPRASTLRVVSADDRHHEVATGASSWMAIAQSIHALGPTLIEAYDQDGKLIRAVRPDDDETNAAANGEHAPAAPLVLPPGTDPQSVMLIHFADLLAGAYRHSTDVAFERLASLFEAVNRRSEALERSLDTTHRLLRRAYQDQLENAEPAKEGDFLGELVGTMVAGAGAAAANQGNGTPSNGKVG